MWWMLLAILFMPSLALAQSRMDQAENALDQVHSWKSLDQWRKKYAPECDDGYISEAIADIVERMMADNWQSLPQLVSLSKTSTGLFKFSVDHLGDITSCENTKKILQNTLTSCPRNYYSYCRQIRQQLDSSETAPECLPTQLRPNNSFKPKLLRGSA